ncbi:uncharacterized protein LOC141904569 isoform X2 [Tubulanus polymorphus]|uniref:uncharacterized protein LOC141904569 isoform X2 n=1 Tax=Tubulanus polymorphus TaxID=672921 RepID=UPI003DA3F66B
METIWLRRSNPNVPWGFRLIGGCDYEQPLSVQRVTEGSIASTGLDKGDWIIKIGCIDASDLTHAQAQEFIKTCPDVLQLTIKKGGNSKRPEPVQNLESNMSAHYNQQQHGYDGYYGTPNGHSPQSHGGEYQPQQQYTSNYNNQQQYEVQHPYPQYEDHRQQYPRYPQFEPAQPYEPPSMHPAHNYNQYQQQPRSPQIQQSHPGYPPHYQQPQHQQPQFQSTASLPQRYGSGYTEAHNEPRSPSKEHVPDVVQRQMTKGGSSKKPFSYIGDDFGDHIKQFKTKNRPRPPAVKLPNQAQRTIDAAESEHPRSPAHHSGPGSVVIQHAQYNSPHQVYSDENVADSFRAQTGGVVTDARPVQNNTPEFKPPADIKHVVAPLRPIPAPPKPTPAQQAQQPGGDKPQWDKSKSAVYSMLHGGDEAPKRRYSPVPQQRVLPPAESNEFLQRKVSNQDDEMTFGGIRETSKNIPSKAFRRLQNMIGVTEHDVLPENQAKPPIPPDLVDNNSESNQAESEEKEAHLYCGDSIPSKAFRRLQISTGGIGPGSVTSSDATQSRSVTSNESSARSTPIKEAFEPYYAPAVPSPAPAQKVVPVLRSNDPPLIPAVKVDPCAYDGEQPGVTSQMKGYRDAEIEGQIHGAQTTNNRRRGSLGLPVEEECGTDF